SLRTDVGDPASMTAGIEAGGARLGTVLFDTDKAVVKPQFDPLLDSIATYLEQQGGGVVSLVGHADRRASDAYNAALGTRRAKAVYEALARRLSPALRARVQVQSSSDPTASAGVAGQ
ncbi:MAG: OmpA family protein, partial [Pseudoxanthomonas sp.]